MRASYREESTLSALEFSALASSFSSENVAKLSFGEAWLGQA
jgi:hypothetical protein